jgi:predicted transcriptional regulator
MKDNIEREIKQYFGSDVSRMKLLGITKSAVATYVLRVQGGSSKESAIKALLFGRRLAAEEIQFVRSVLERLPSAAVKGAGG